MHDTLKPPVAATVDWTLADYVALLRGIQRRGAKFRSLGEYSTGSAGVWLRHDVELDCDHAIQMARAESAVGVRASYFICVESPFLSDADIEGTLRALRELGHVVSYHLVLGTDVSAVQPRVAEFTSRWSMPEPAAVTFHAPGLPVDLLAQAPYGQIVYEPLASQRGAYFSDSTGRWRWGTPGDQIDPSVATQLLTHPYWWAGSRTALLARCRASPACGNFLPQLLAAS